MIILITNKMFVLPLLLLTLLLGTSLTGITGCGSIMGSSDNTVNVVSHPSGAKVYYRGQYIGKTPIQVVADSAAQPGTVVVKKEGYKTASAQITNKFQLVGVLNVVFWPGFLVDIATGKTMKIKDHELSVLLEDEYGQDALLPAV